VNDQVRWLARALRPSAFVRAWGAPSRVKVVNNPLVGPGDLLRGAGEGSHNLQSSDPGLVDLRGVRLLQPRGAAAAGAWTDGGSLNGFSLTPVAQYAYRTAEEPWPCLGAVDIGASGCSGTGRRALNV